jgi:hypothetical protein
MIDKYSYYIQSIMMRLFAKDKQLYMQIELIAAAVEVSS